MYPYVLISSTVQKAQHTPIPSLSKLFSPNLRVHSDPAAGVQPPVRAGSCSSERGVLGCSLWLLLWRLGDGGWGVEAAFFLPLVGSPREEDGCTEEDETG